MKYIICKCHSILGTLMIIERTNNGKYADERVKQLNHYNRQNNIYYCCRTVV